MIKKFVILNIDNNQYYTGRFWDYPYTTNIREAKIYDTEEVIIEESNTEQVSELFSKVSLFEVKTIFSTI